MESFSAASRLSEIWRVAIPVAERQRLMAHVATALCLAHLCGCAGLELVEGILVTVGGGCRLSVLQANAASWELITLPRAFEAHGGPQGRLPTSIFSNKYKL